MILYALSSLTVEAQSLKINEASILLLSSTAVNLWRLKNKLLSGGYVTVLMKIKSAWDLFFCLNVHVKSGVWTRWCHGGLRKVCYGISGNKLLGIESHVLLTGKYVIDQMYLWGLRRLAHKCFQFILLSHDANQDCIKQCVEMAECRGTDGS